MAILHLEDLRIGPGDALIVTDMQVDFMPGGRLPVPGGDEIIAPLNRAIALFVARGLPVVATRDWHPPHHISFKARGGPWPPHCVQGSLGAAFVSELELPRDAILISKATDPEREAYSTFSGTELANHLQALGVHHVFLGGVATEYCILNSARDALDLCLSVSVLVDSVRAVDVEPHDGDRALREMLALGAVAVEAGPHLHQLHPEPSPG